MIKWIRTNKKERDLLTWMLEDWIAEYANSAHEVVLDEVDLVQMLADRETAERMLEKL
jgi:hypothetical protein